MKHYDREKRMYVDEDEFNALNKKRKLCKNNSEHDFVLVLPEWSVTYDDKYDFKPEVYYTAYKAIQDFERSKYAELESKGIIVKRYVGPCYKTYRCTKCMKTKSEEY